MANLETNKLQKLAEEFAVMIQTKSGTISRMNAEEWFKAGFKKAESLKEKNYSHKQMVDAILFGMQKGLNVDKIKETDNNFINNYINSLK